METEVDGDDEVATGRDRSGTRRVPRPLTILLCCVVGLVVVRVVWPTFEQRRFALSAASRAAELYEDRYRESVRPALERGVDGQPVTISDLCMRNCKPSAMSDPDDLFFDPLHYVYFVPLDMVERVVGPARSWDTLLVASTPAPTDTVDAETLAALAERDLGSSFSETAASLRSERRPFDLNAHARTAVQWALAACVAVAGAVAWRRRDRSPRPVDLHPDRAVV